MNSYQILMLLWMMLAYAVIKCSCTSASIHVHNHALTLLFIPLLLNELENLSYKYYEIIMGSLGYSQKDWNLSFSSVLLAPRTNTINIISKYKHMQIHLNIRYSAASCCSNGTNIHTHQLPIYVYICTHTRKNHIHRRQLSLLPSANIITFSR